MTQESNTATVIDKLIRVDNDNANEDGDRTVVYEPSNDGIDFEPSNDGTWNQTETAEKLAGLFSITVNNELSDSRRQVESFEWEGKRVFRAEPGQTLSFTVAVNDVARFDSVLKRLPAAYHE